MKTIGEHDYATYPRRFDGYKWYKPLLVGLLYAVFSIISMIVIELITKLLLSASVSSTGYDDMDFFTTAGAFYNGAAAAVAMPCLLLAARIIKDRPISSYFSSMGGWRWKVFFKTFAAGLLIVGIPSVVWFSLPGKTGCVKFMAGGFLLLTLFIPLQGLGEELVCRGFIMQTVSSWFKLTFAGVIVQTVLFTVVHPYNITGIISIAVSGLLYALICLYSKGIESPSILHIFNNAAEIYMAGFGYRLITAEQTIPDVVVNLTIKALFFLFILYADKKLHWFDEVKTDDVVLFNSQRKS